MRLRPLSEIDPDKDEVTWKVILGPEGIEPVTGSANGEAIYRPVPGAADRFALIDVEIKKPGPLGTKRGWSSCLCPCTSTSCRISNEQPTALIPAGPLPIDQSALPEAPRLPRSTSDDFRDTSAAVVVDEGRVK